MSAGRFFMTEMTTKELDMLTAAVTREALLGRKAALYSRTLTDPDIAACMANIAKGHAQRCADLLKAAGGRND